MLRRLRKTARGQFPPFAIVGTRSLERLLRSVDGRSSTDDGVVLPERHDWRRLIDRDDRHKR